VIDLVHESISCGQIILGNIEPDCSEIVPGIRCPPESCHRLRLLLSSCEQLATRGLYFLDIPIGFVTASRLLGRVR
jgi:hypothetical protein